MADDENKPKSFTAQDVANMQAAAEAANKHAIAMGEVNEGMEAQVQLQASLAKSADDQLKAILEAKVSGDEKLAQLEKELEAIGKNEEKQTSADKLRLEAIKKEQDSILALKGTKEEVIKQLQDMRAEGQAVAEKFGEIVSAGANLDKTIGNAAEALTGIGGSWRKSVWGSTLSAAQSRGWSAAISDVGKGLKETFTPMNIAGSLITGVVQQTMKMVKTIDSAQSGFRKATGAGGAYDDVISDIYKDNKLAGVSFEDAAQAVQGLMGSMAGFGRMSQTTQAEWGGLAATMKELNISLEDSGALFTNATKVMGMNRTQTEAMVGEMQGLADELGTNLGPLMSEFNASMSDLAVYGDDAVGIFKRLKGASDVLGISVGNLVGSMKEMDTIEGAATRAGTLNAVLQGQFLDTHELLNASYEDRILLTRKAIDASGKDWASMGRAERQMVANAAGFSDMAEAAKFMTTSVSDLESSMNSAGEASGSITEIKDRAAKAQTITEKFSQGMESLAIAAEPLVDILSALAGAFAVLMDSKLGYVLGFASIAFLVIGGTIATVYGLLTALATIQATVTALKAADSVWSYFQAQASTTAAVAKKVETEVTEELTDAQEEQNEVQQEAAQGGNSFLSFLRELAEIASDNVRGLLALGATFIMIGIGVAIAAVGVAQLVMAFKGFSAGEILAISVALLVFGATMVGMMYVLVLALPMISAAGAGILWFGLAVITLSIAAVILAHAFGMVVGYIIQLIPHISTLASGLMDLAPAIALVSLAAMLIGPAGAAAYVGFVMMSAGLAILAAGLVYFALTAGWAMIVFGAFIVAMLMLGVAMLLVGNNSTAFADLMEQVDNLTSDTVGRVYELANAIESVGDSLANISVPNALVLTMLLEEIGYVAEHAPSVTPPVVGNIEKLVGAAAEYSEIKWSFFGVAGMMLDPFINMLKAAVGTGGGTAATGGGKAAGDAGGGGSTTVVLELDGQVLGRTVEAVLNKRNRLRAAVD